MSSSAAETAPHGYVEYEFDGRLHQSAQGTYDRLNGLLRRKKDAKTNGASRTARCHQKKIDQGLKRISVYVPPGCEVEVKTLAERLTAEHLAENDKHDS